MRGGEKVQIAKVIVDVPLMQTDKPYSYAVPKEFSTMLEIGMRVHVPFGKANRLIQGIVVELAEETTTELKEIAEVLDFTPVLNEEQLWLAEELRKSVFSYKISILKAMLPGFLNSSYDKILHAQPSLNEEDRLLIFGNEEQQHFLSLDKELQAKVMRLTRQGAIQVEYQAIDQKHIKTEKWYQVNQGILEQLVIPQRANKKQALRDVLQAQTAMYRLADLKEHFSREVIHYFVEQEAVQIIEKEVSRSEAYFENVATDSALVLNEEQGAAVQAITQQIEHGGKPFLLEGVTGSGKTEVYLQVIQEALSRGKTAIMLVPEISLTPQVTNRFISRFGKKVAILHSGLSNGEKYDEWRKVERGEAQVVVGARSAIFAPLKNIGAIIIDEEHEASYKQDSNPRYHARDVALLRAKYNQAVLVLGSATPSLESRARAGKGVYHFCN